MAQMSDYLESKLIDHVFRNIGFITPGIIHVALYATDPTDSDIGTELEATTSPGYVRQTVHIGADTGGVALNDIEVLFPAATGDWVNITHIGIRDESTGGNLLMHKILSAPVSVLDTNNFRIPIGDLELTFA